MGFGAVDIGNTSIKFCIWGDGGEWSSLPKSLSEVVDVFRDRGVDKVAYCTTRHLDSAERRLIEDEGWWGLSATEPLPLKIEYSTPATLGLDRLAAALGAPARFPSETVLIADIGTALTLDVVTAGGVFKGGNISPGLTMRLKALHHYTSKLPEVESLICEGLLGTDTTGAIQLGALWGVANEIGGMFRLVKRDMGCDAVVLTGGDAPFMRSYVKKALDGEARLEWEYALVAEGLKIAYDYNHE